MKVRRGITIKRYNMEVWTELKVQTVKGKYYVSNTGKVKKVYNNGKERILKNSANTQGYLQLDCRLKGKGQLEKGKMYVVHRLVAEMYIPNPDNKPFVDHIDKNKQNNHYTNLRWATRSENGSNRTNGFNYKNLKGVGKVTKKLYRARITKDKKTIHLGYFKTEKEAHEAYCAKAKELHGEFASLV